MKYLIKLYKTFSRKNYDPQNLKMVVLSIIVLHDQDDQILIPVEVFQVNLFKNMLF